MRPAGPGRPRGDVRRTLSYLELVRAEVGEGVYAQRQGDVLAEHYADPKGWRLMLIFRLIGLFVEAKIIASKGPGENCRPYVREALGMTDPPGERDRQELLKLLAEEIASVEEELEYEERQNQERAAIEREACLAPEGKTWEMLLRQESGLDRAIDRKVKILLQLRKEHAQLRERPPTSCNEMIELRGHAGQRLRFRAGGEAPPSFRETPTPKRRGHACDTERRLVGHTRRRHTRQCLRHPSILPKRGARGSLRKQKI